MMAVHTQASSVWEEESSVHGHPPSADVVAWDHMPKQKREGKKGR